MSPAPEGTVASGLWGGERRRARKERGQSPGQPAGWPVLGQKRPWRFTVQLLPGQVHTKAGRVTPPHRERGMGEAGCNQESWDLAESRGLNVVEREIGID